MVLVGAVVLAIVGLMRIPTNGATTSDAPVRRPSADRVGGEDEVSSTWFCAATGAPVEPVPTHRLYVSDTGDVASEVRVSAYGPDGLIDVKIFPIEPRVMRQIDIDGEFGAAGLSAMVESASGTIAVSHGLISTAMGDVAPCQRNAAHESYFPSQTTLTGTSAQLVLFNPFSADASVDLVAAVVDGIRSPTEWAGVVIPAGSTRTIDLSEQVQRRDQFALTVRVRSGRVFTEMVQTYDGIAVDPATNVKGLRLVSPVVEPRSSWTFAGGFTDGGATEIIVVQNPTTEKVDVTVQVFPDGAADLLPEPFELSIPAGWYSTLDLTAEGRVPDVGFHSIVVEAGQDAGVVVQRRVSLSAEPVAASEPDLPERPRRAQGIAGSPGVNGAARSWWATGFRLGGANTPLLWIRNSDDRPVEVSINGTTASGETVVLAEGESIAAGDSVTVPLPTAPEGTTAMYLVEASGPVVVEQLLTLDDVPDFSMVPAFPLDP